MVGSEPSFDRNEEVVILTTREVAELLKIPPRTVEDWRISGSGPRYRKIGKHVRYELRDVLAWLRSN